MAYSLMVKRVALTHDSPGSNPGTPIRINF